MSPAINEETLQKLRDNAEATAKQFGISYCLNAAWTIYERAREAAETKEPDTLKLTYRKFDSVIRTDLLTGYVDVREGEGPGAMSGWKKVYCVEKNDYGIEFYSSQAAYELHKKPKTTIQPAGYTVVTKNIARPFRKLIEPIASGLDIDSTILDEMVKFSDDCWALFHPQRTKYVFRMCESSKKFRCCCHKNEYVNIDDEEKIERTDWIYFLQTCVRRFKARNADTVLGMAFEKASNKISAKVEALKDWKNNGTEDEMLLEMVMTSCLPPVQDTVLQQIKGSIPLASFGSCGTIAAGRLLIPAWYKELDLIKKTIQKVLGVVWTQIQQQAQALLDKIEPVLAKGLTPINIVHSKILNGIREVTGETIGRLLSKNVTPLIEPIIEAYAKPLTEGFKCVRKTFLTAVIATDLPQDATERRDFLDAIPRRRITMRTCYSHALQLANGLGPAKRMIEDTMKMIISKEDEDAEEKVDGDAEDLCSMAEESFLKGLDATVYTLHLRLENGEEMNENLKELLLTEGFDCDVIQLKREIVKKGIRQFVLKYLHRAIDADEGIRKALASVDAPIPSEMKDFLSVQSIFDGFIAVAVGEPIDRMVEAAEALK